MAAVAALLAATAVVAGVSLGVAALFSGGAPHGAGGADPRPSAPTASPYQIDEPVEIAATEIACPAGAGAVRRVPQAVRDRIFSFVRLLDREWHDAARLAAVRGSPASRAPYEQEFADIALLSVGERLCRRTDMRLFDLTIEVSVRRVLNSRWPEAQQTVYVTMQRVRGEWRVYAFGDGPRR